MPTTISQLETAFNLKVKESFLWGTSFNEKSFGVYIISTSSKKSYLPVHNTLPILNNSQLEEWSNNAPSMSLHGCKAKINELAKHLSRFWLPDESILYIGKAEKQSLSQRISQFYNHKVGKKSPHKGGYWLKLLSNLNELHIHLIPSKNPHVIEENMLEYFINNVSESSKVQLIDKKLHLPFANLQLRSGVIKAHGLMKHYE